MTDVKLTEDHLAVLGKDALYIFDLDPEGGEVQPNGLTRRQTQRGAIGKWCDILTQLDQFSTKMVPGPGRIIMHRAETDITVTYRSESEAEDLMKGYQ